MPLNPETAETAMDDYKDQVLEGEALERAIEAAKIKAQYMKRTEGTILCCMCGVSIKPNRAGRCMSCLRQEIDITAGIGKELVLGPYR